MITVGEFMGFACGLFIGAAWCAVASPGGGNEFAGWLGRECWVRPVSRPRWRRHVVVAVSWKGAVCVREADRTDGNGYWIKKQSVPFRVSFDDACPEGEE